MPPPSIQHALEIARQHHHAGQLPQAEALYRQILAQNPAHPDALQLLGLLACQSGHADRAIDLISRAIALQPNFPEAYSHLGMALQANGQPDQAIAAYRHAATLMPTHPVAFANLGVILKSQHQFDAAIAAFHQAIVLDPTDPEVFNDLGNALAATGKLDAAITAYHQAAALNPNHADAFCNLGIARQTLGQFVQAMAAFRQAIALRPDHAKACSNLGALLFATGQWDDALAAFHRALALDHTLPEAHNNLGNALKEIGHLDDAIVAFRQTLTLNPHLSGAHSNLVFTMHYHPAYDAQSIAQELHRWNQQHAEPLKKNIPPHANDPTPHRRLRIGYVSSDFYEHASAYFLTPLLAAHDHRHFEIFAYAQVAQPDHLTARMRALADHWHNTVGLSDDALAQLIQHHQIDILVDLKLHTGGNRLLVFARKPAPIQASWLGHPGGTGLTAIDYRLSDPHLDPPVLDDSADAREIIRLPDCFWCYDPLQARDLPCNPLPALSRGHITFGCLNNSCKITDSALRLWAKVLHAVPSSRLLLLTSVAPARQRMLHPLQREGIASHRIEFIPFQPRRNYMELYHRIDIGLDTFPYNGHTTSLDGFFMGVPIVTLVGQTPVGRGGLSILSNLGLHELAAHSPEQYVQIARDLASDLPRLTALRTTLRQRMEHSPLMNSTRFTKNIESVYRRMWESWCAEKQNPQRQ